jgi:hypothetical protein
MDAPFPFGLPLPTAFYMVLYVVTLAIHVAFMNYVLSGTAALAIAFFRSRGRGLSDSMLLLKDWMPLMLSGAITAGIAPLLFLQILYKREYYTANLLLFNRWMSILPILIIGFYALYLLKSKWLSRRSPWLICLVGLVPILCIAFTGYTWTENNLLSVRDSQYWGEFYATKSQVYSEAQLVPRLLVWAVGSIPTMILILSWQHLYHTSGSPRILSRVAMLGLILTSGAAAWYYLATNDTTRSAFISPMALPYFAIACLGLAIQMAGWFMVGKKAKFEWKSLLVPTSGSLLTILGMTVCREVVRISTLGKERFEALYPIHAEAFDKGGFLLFLGFFTLNAALIGFVFWLVRHRTRPDWQTTTEKV